MILNKTTRSRQLGLSNDLDLNSRNLYYPFNGILTHIADSIVSLELFWFLNSMQNLFTGWQTLFDRQEKSKTHRIP